MVKNKVSHNTKKGVMLTLAEVADIKTFLYLYKLEVIDNAKRHFKMGIMSAASWDMQKLRRIEELDRKLGEFHKTRGVEMVFA